MRLCSQHYALWKKTEDPPAILPERGSSSASDIFAGEVRFRQ